MNNKTIEKIIKKSRRKPEMQRTDDYISAQLQRDGLYTLTLQMGPNCSLKCSHCYGSYGSDRADLPEPTMVEKLMHEAENIRVNDIVLTDGEPIREENRECMSVISRYSKSIPVSIITNGLFADSEHSAINWFDFLKNEGFDLSRKRNMLQVSCGPMYAVDQENYFYLMKGLYHVFPHVDYGRQTSFRYLITDDGQYNIVENIIVSMRKVFGKGGEIKSHRNGYTKFIHVPVTEALHPIRIYFMFCRPQGRALNSEFIRTQYPEQEVLPQDMGFHPDLEDGLWISYDGNVSFGRSGACIRNGKFYGNIKHDELSAIKGRILEDPVYCAFKLGGARFMYHLARQVDESFQLKARTRCDVCNNVFSSTESTDAIRNYLMKTNIVHEYKSFMSDVQDNYKM